MSKRVVKFPITSYTSCTSAKTVIRVPSSKTIKSGSFKKTKVSKKSSKRKGIPKLEKGTLRKYGYNSSDLASQRREALDRAVSDWNYSGVVHKLNAIRVLQKNTNPVLSRKFHSDMLWLKKKYRS